MRFAMTLVASIALVGCTTAKPLTAPSGARGYKVWCEVTSQCYEKAAQVCPSGYAVEVDQKDYWGLGDYDGNLIIVCKGAGASNAQQAQPASAEPMNYQPRIP
ncbi:hypothetical protein MMG85_11915 [Pseudoxanthomonas sp. LH2527]|uniref:hypothetical protein n=1 Tax=Pseudoxanthomonas sp. LH2527 TaxID=2923249 RepID=UPI001F12E5C5|nr:hypothetical protein [Pseudoxanthomonas sp. LH2527]MCH6484264.1 hypothetical protein [Pseudoxanthomonas sp. LH2527]